MTDQGYEESHDEGSGGRRDQAEERGGRHESRERVQDKQGLGPGGARREERCVSSRRSSFVVDLDRSLRPCGVPPAAPVFVVGTGDVPAVTRRQETYLQPVAPDRAARIPRDRVDNEHIQTV